MIGKAATRSTRHADEHVTSYGWPTSELHVIDDMGHGGGDTFLDAVTASLSRVASS
jgi:hypothetical protein